MNVALRRKRGRAREAIAEAEELGRRQLLATTAGGLAVAAAGAYTARAIARRGNGTREHDGQRPTGGTKAHSYGRDNPSGPGYNWPPEPPPG